MGRLRNAPIRTQGYAAKRPSKARNQQAEPRLNYWKYCYPISGSIKPKLPSRRRYSTLTALD
jgi:hypothetical protein